MVSRRAPRMLPLGVAIISEWQAGPYWLVRILPHPLFPEIAVRHRAMTVRRSRVVATVTLGRPIAADEHVHHRNGDRTDDRPENLEVLRSDEHNRHHKTGARHRAEAKARIADGLRRAYAEGRRDVTIPDWTGKRHTPETRAAQSVIAKVAHRQPGHRYVAPPSSKGRKHSPETKAKMREAALRRHMGKAVAA